MKTEVSGLAVAPLLPLSLIAVLPAPAGNSPVSLALAWLLFMLLAALPAAFLDMALVRRSRQWPVQGVVPVTRDSDLHTRWRLIPWLGLAAALGLSAILAQGLMTVVPVSPAWLPEAAPYAALLLAAGVVFMGAEALLPLAGALSLLAVIAGLALNPPDLALAPLTTEGWRHAALMALVAAGSSAGLHAWWAQRTLSVNTPARSLTAFWLIQSVAGVLAILATSHSAAGIAPCLAVIPAVTSLILLLQIVVQQLRSRNYPLPVALGGAGLACAGLVALSVVPGFAAGIQALSLLALVGLSLLVGWAMKISHVRKALAFGSEALYNLWRVAVRLLLPLLCLWALTGLWH